MTPRPVNNIKPLIAIVGRPNVGKSTLFNQILGKNAAIVDDLPGVTRDLHYEDILYDDKPFTVIDTGGFHIDEAGDAITLGIRRQIEEVFASVDGVLVVGDGLAGLHPADRDILDIVRRTGIRHWLVVSKVDDEHREPHAAEFYETGTDQVFPVSGTTGYGVRDLLDEMTKEFWTAREIAEKLPPPADEVRIAVIGRPNVGKSTLVNALLGEERMLVSPIPGTTMDPIDSVFTRDGRTYRIIDTAGIRRKKNISLKMESAAVVRAFKSIDRADIALFLMDATEPATDQDLRVIGLAHEKNRGIILALNKWDLVVKDEKTYDKLVKDLRERIKFAPYAPILSLSALERQRVGKVLDLVNEVYGRYTRSIDTATLTDWLMRTVQHTPPPLAKFHKPIVFRKAEMSSVRPPTVTISVNKPDSVHFSYERYLTNRFYASFDYTGVAVRFLFRRSSR
ncbi:MAG TPA: ribosome biogenesis GTPase Der [bacterium]|nr:ribosome biogenesis GTPase Der [bacterium]